MGLGDPLIDMAEGLTRDSNICRVIDRYGSCNDTPRIVQGEIMAGQLNKPLLEEPVDRIIGEAAARPSAPQAFMRSSTRKHRTIVVHVAADPAAHAIGQHRLDRYFGLVFRRLDRDWPDLSHPKY